MDNRPALRDGTMHIMTTTQEFTQRLAAQVKFPAQTIERDRRASVAGRPGMASGCDIQGINEVIDCAMQWQVFGCVHTKLGPKR